jgi:hypothetical protein
MSFWKSALLPLIRSPRWLLVRVSMQLALERQLTSSRESLYKPFMAFLHAQVLEMAVEKLLQSEIVHSMNAKLSQRLLKLGDSKHHVWFKQIQDIMTRPVKMVQSRWESIMTTSSPKSPRVSLESTQVAQDVLHKLPESDCFLQLLDSLPASRKSFEFSSTEKL